MNILVVSYHFYPENTPRAFRTFELVRQFCKNGHKVHLLLPNKSVFTDKPVQLQNLEISYLGPKIQIINRTGVPVLPKKNVIKSIVKGAYTYFNPFANSYSYINQLFSFLKSHQKSYEFIVSIGVPVASHIGVGLALKRNKQLGAGAVKVAEYSDPFSNQSYAKMFLAYKSLEKYVIKSFDYIIVPTPKAISSYLNMKDESKIKVIPQGFDFSETKITGYEKNPVPTFSYAGIFYDKIRNPEFFFQHLTKLTSDFRFIVFARKTNFTAEVLHKYKALLGEKLVIHYDLARLDLINELSKMDFLINLDNNTSSQVPSKLIDYSLSRRPIYSTSQDSFNADVFNDFLSGNYETQMVIDIEDYNIVNVARKFIDLSNNKI